MTLKTEGRREAEEVGLLSAHLSPGQRFLTLCGQCVSDQTELVNLPGPPISSLFPCPIHLPSYLSLSLFNMMSWGGGV